MKKLIISLIVIIIGIFVVDRLGGQIMWWVNQHSHDATAPKIKYLVDDVKEDIVLMGTSRCQGHYVSSIIKDTLGMSVFNGGVDASENIYSHYILLSHLLAHHAPKVICLDVRRNELYQEADPFKAITLFAPYFGRNASADSVYRLAGTDWEYRLSHLYRYNSKAASNILGLIYNKQSSKGEDQGYIPIAKPPKPLSISDDISMPRNTIIDDNKLVYLRKFINDCKNKNVQLVFVVSPTPSHVDGNYYAELKRVAQEYGVPFLDYHTPGLYLDHPEYFKDGQHLWDEGARAFSQIFAHDLKEILILK